MRIVQWVSRLGITAALVACGNGESDTGSNVSETTGEGSEHSNVAGTGVLSGTIVASTDAPANTGAPATVEPPASTGSAQNDGTGSGGASAETSDLPGSGETGGTPTSDDELTNGGDSEEVTAIPEDSATEEDRATAEDTETLVDDETDPLPNGGTTPVDEGEVFMCMPDAEEDGCEFCVQRDCCDERSECAADEQCSAEWDGMKICMAERELRRNPVADPMAIVQECIVDVAGGELAASDALYALLSCVGSPFFEGNADDNRIEGDGMCTWACYGVDTLEPVAADPEFDFP